MFDKVLDILENYSSIPAEGITMDSNLQRDLKLNSLDVINIVVEFEEAFEMEIEDADVRSFSTVGDLVHYLELSVPQPVLA